MGVLGIVLVTIAVLVVLEGLVLYLFSKDIKKICIRCGKNKKLIKKYGMWEIVIGVLLLVAAIFASVS